VTKASPQIFDILDAALMHSKHFLGRSASAV